MTTRPPSLLRNAYALLSVRFVLMQIGLVLLVFLLSLLWLQMPDASVLEVAASGLLGILILAIAGAGEASLILRLCDRARTRARLFRGALLILFGVALWYAWSVLLAHLQVKDVLHAGYLNSRFPHSLRNVFSYPHILLWLGWMWTTLVWIGAGIITVFAFAMTASVRPVRVIARALGSVTWWLSLLIGIYAATMITDYLIAWTPGHGLRIEALSLIVRFVAIALIDGSIVSLLLAIPAACVRRTDAANQTPAGTPDDSQPRTVEES
jgi:hypothetical protein